MLQTAEQRDKMLTVRDGYLICPNCRRNKRLMKINPDTQGHGIVAYCRDCKTEIILDIEQGQSVKRRSQ